MSVPNRTCRLESTYGTSRRSSRPPTICTKYPSSRSRFRSGLRLSGFCDIEDSPLLDLDLAAGCQLARGRLGRGVAIRHGVDDVGVRVRCGESQLHDLLERHLVAWHLPGPRIDDDF